MLLIGDQPSPSSSLSASTPELESHDAKRVYVRQSIVFGISKWSGYNSDPTEYTVNVAANSLFPSPHYRTAQQNFAFC